MGLNGRARLISSYSLSYIKGYELLKLSSEQSPHVKVFKQPGLPCTTQIAQLWQMENGQPWSALPGRCRSAISHARKVLSDSLEVGPMQEKAFCQ